MTGNGRINMSACYFLIELWGRMPYTPTLMDEKGAFSLSAVGRGWGGLARGGLLLSIDIVRKGIRGLGDVGRD